jgi:hypothetical protein
VLWYHAAGERVAAAPVKWWDGVQFAYTCPWFAGAPSGWHVQGVVCYLLPLVFAWATQLTKPPFVGFEALPSTIQRVLPVMA